MSVLALFKMYVLVIYAYTHKRKRSVYTLLLTFLCLSLAVIIFGKPLTSCKWHSLALLMAVQKGSLCHYSKNNKQSSSRDGNMKHKHLRRKKTSMINAHLNLLACVTLSHGVKVNIYLQKKPPPMAAASHLVCSTKICSAFQIFVNLVHLLSKPTWQQSGGMICLLIKSARLLEHRNKTGKLLSIKEWDL